MATTVSATFTECARTHRGARAHMVRETCVNLPHPTYLPNQNSSLGYVSTPPSSSSTRTAATVDGHGEHPELIEARPGVWVRHLDEDRTCDCECAVCTRRGVGDEMVCICPDCDAAACGIHDAGRST